MKPNDLVVLSTLHPLFEDPELTYFQKEVGKIVKITCITHSYTDFGEIVVFKDSNANVAWWPIEHVTLIYED